jgi:prepilin-type N-terminal cleavage/methylation domain-containing protein
MRVRSICILKKKLKILVIIIKMKKNKGFTLIELLVVIAIIGILASVVLASLNTARNKGKDASAKSSISSIRAAAELYYNGAGLNNYMTTPAAGGATSVDSGLTTATVSTVNVCQDSEVVKLAKAAKLQTSQPVNCVVGTNGQSYVLYGQLNGQVSPANFCVDSSGFSGELAAAPAAIAANAAVRCQ